MRLIKITSIAALLLLSAHKADAQVYINLGIGYGAPALRDLVAIDYHSTQSSQTYKGIYSSLGMGFQPDVIIGYKVNPNIGFEVGYGYLIGSRITGEIDDGSSPNVETGTQEISARMSRIMIATRVT